MKSKSVTFSRAGLARLGEIVKNARTTLVYEGRVGVSYKKFQDLTGLSHATIWQIEVAADLKKEAINKSIKHDTLEMLAPHVGYRVEELIQVCDGTVVGENSRMLAFAKESGGLLGFQNSNAVSAEEVWNNLIQHITSEEILQLVVIVIKRSHLSEAHLAVLLKAIAESMEAH